MQGDQVKALKIISLAKGWDPDRIYDPNAGYGESIENFNKPTQVLSNQAGTGRLPQGTPDSFPDAEQPRYSESITFNTPDYGRENVNRRTNGADPTPDMPGA